MGVHNVSFSILKKLNKDGSSYKNFSLKDYTTFKIGGKTKYFLEIKTLENFIKVMLYIENKSDYFILGNGSNLLISDGGYDGIVIKLSGAFSKIQIKDNLMEVGAGAILGSVISSAKENSLGGIESAVCIPATMGGAVYMNAGAYGFEMSQVVEYVVAYSDGKIRYFTNVMCGFDYRKSIFMSGKYIILRVGLKLEKKDINEIQNNIMEVVKKRNESQPLTSPSAGSIFKRIDGLNVSKMLDEMGVKGLSIGGACVSTKHANFIINDGGATANEVYTLILKIKKLFREKYNINLETEIKFLGEINEING